MPLMRGEQPPTAGHASVKRLLAAALVGLQLQAATVQACNYVKFQAGDGTTIAGRDMQFAKTQESWPTQFRTRPKGMKFKIGDILDPKYAKPGSLASWTVKYPYIAVNVFDAFGSAVDGMNMEGLQCSALLLPGYAEYQIPPPGAGSKTIPQYSVCDWVLGLHKTVGEVNATLPTIYVAGLTFGPLGQPPLHYAITDKTGTGIIVEYTNNGTLNIYDNQVGVLTNSPPYDWQLINLGQIAPTMSPVNPAPVMYGNIEFQATGMWGNMIGLPGNAPAPSRFAKLAVSLHFAQNATFIPTGDDGVNLAVHLLNVAEVVNGTLFGLPPTNKNAILKYDGDTSLWQVIFNLQTNTLRFRSYNNYVWQVVNLNQLDFSEGAPVYVLDMYNNVPPPDMTNKFKAAKEL